MLLFLIIYVVGFVLSYGMFFAYWQRKWPSLEEKRYGEDVRCSLFFAIFWFLSIIVYITFSADDKKFYGFKWK